MAIKPHAILLVVDAMTGQEAVNVATEFDQQIGLTGVILTKIDGDARGGAALSVKEVVGKPILFVYLEGTHELIAGRIATRELPPVTVASVVVSIVLPEPEPAPDVEADGQDVEAVYLATLAARDHALGLLAGEPAMISITALRREEAPNPTPDATKPLLDANESVGGAGQAQTDVAATATAALDAVAGAAATPAQAAEKPATKPAAKPVAKPVPSPTPKSTSVKTETPKSAISEEKKDEDESTILFNFSMDFLDLGRFLSPFPTWV